MARTKLEKPGKSGDDVSYVDLDAQSQPRAQTGNIPNGDTSMTSTREDRFRRGPLVAAFFGLGMGLLLLANGLNRPGISSMRTVDIVYLTGTGASFGVGLVWLVVYFTVYIL